VTLPFLDDDAVLGALPFADAVDALERALAGGLDPAAGVDRSIVEVAHGQLLLMPAETATATGVKLATVAPGNASHGLPRIQALYVLLDRTTLRPLALLDGTALTTAPVGEATTLTSPDIRSRSSASSWTIGSWTPYSSAATSAPTTRIVSQEPSTSAAGAVPSRSRSASTAADELEPRPEPITTTRPTSELPCCGW
jgi:hypothetical protein